MKRDLTNLRSEVGFRGAFDGPQKAGATAGGRMQLADFLRVYQTRHEFGISPSTVDQYRYTCVIFGAWIGRDPGLDDLTDERVTLWVDWLREHYRPATAKSQRANLLALWRAAWELGLIDRPQLRVRKIRLPRTTPRAWTLEECRLVLGQAEIVQGLFRSTPIRRGPHLSAMIRTLWDSGLRLVDCLRIDRDQIGSAGSIVLIQHKTAVEVACWLSRGTLEAIDATMQDQPDRRRIWPLATRTYQEWIGWLVARAGLRGSIKWLRRSAATAAEMEQPGAGQRLLGHTRGDTTARYYLDPRLLQRPVRPPEL